jgi:hypothetical protein
MDRKSSFTLFLVCLVAAAILLYPFFASTCLAKNVSLGWDANPEPDLEGYTIYRNVGSPGPPYQFSSTLPEDDLSNPLAPVVTLTGLRENIEYFIAVTAYDTEGNESHFSDQICVEIVDSVIENCSASLIGYNSSSKSGGGSGVFACFINSTAGDLNHAALLGEILVFGFLVLGALIFMRLAVGIKRRFQTRLYTKFQA